MIHWLRLILSVFALAGLLAAGTGAAVAAKSVHHCCPAMAMADHHTSSGHHQTKPLPCCVAGICAFVKPNLASRVAAPAFQHYADRFSLVRDDVGPPSQSLAPDLRPPIA